MNASRVTRTFVRRMSSLKDPGCPTQPMDQGYKALLSKKHFFGNAPGLVHVKNPALLARNYLMYGLSALGVALVLQVTFKFSFPKK